MAKIQLTPAELMSQSAEMASLKSRYEEIFQEVNGILNEVNQNWSANLANNFAGKIKTAQNGFSKITDMLQTGADIAEKSSKSFESVDSQLANLFLNGAGVNENYFGAGATALAAGLGHHDSQSADIQRIFQDELTDSWGNLGDTVKAFEKWRETQAGKGADKLYDALDKIMGKDDSLGQWKQAYEIAKDIITGDVSWDTAETFGKAVSKSDSKISALIDVGKMIFDEDSYYVNRAHELENQAAEHLRQGDLLGTAVLMTGEFFDVVGKGVLNAGGQLIVDTLHLDTVNDVLTQLTGVDIGKGISDINDAIGTGFSEFVDASGEFMGEVSEKIGEFGAAAIESVGDAFTDISDKIGDFFNGLW